MRVPDPVGSPPAVAAPRPKRLAGLDGLRGLAALYVFASVVEIPFLTQHTRSTAARMPEPRAWRVPA